VPVLEQWLKDIDAEKGFVIFQQDSAPSHTAKTTQRWFEEHSISLLCHPANSPDLNPIEHVWHELKRRLRSLKHHPTNLDQLKEAIKRVWEEIPVEDVNKYIDRMPQIVQALKSAKGGHTKF
jgi:transposase